MQEVLRGVVIEPRHHPRQLTPHVLAWHQLQRPKRQPCNRQVGGSYVACGVRPVWWGVVPHQQVRLLRVAMLRQYVHAHPAVCPFAPLAHHAHYRPRDHVHRAVEDAATVFATDLHDCLFAPSRPHPPALLS